MEYVMGVSAKKTDSFYKYSDYLKWDDDKRREIIDGKIHLMVPAPSIPHQDISGRIYRLIANFLEDKDCKVFIAPADVILIDDDEETKDSGNIVQPDILVVCDEEKITHKGIVGAPDICIEILSPHTSAKDKKEKFYLYEKFGVNEYWLVHPDDKTITIFKLDDAGSYGRPEVYADDDKFDCTLLKGLSIDLTQIFKTKISKEKIEREPES